MIVCLCTGVTCEQFMAALDKAQGRLGEAANETGAGHGCGGCRPYLFQLAHERKDQLASAAKNSDPQAPGS